MGSDTNNSGEEANSVIDLDRITRAMEGGKPISDEKPLVEGRSDLVEDVTTFNQFDPSRASISNARCDDGDRFGSVKNNSKTEEKYDIDTRKMRNELIRAYMFRGEKIPSKLRSMDGKSIKVLFTALSRNNWFPTPNEVYNP